MNTEAQIEALAAMRKVLFTTDTAHLLELGQYEEAAATTLAALDGWTLVEEAEIARLRKIEEAARAICLSAQAILDWYEAERWAGPHDSLKEKLAVLRAALEADDA